MVVNTIQALATSVQQLLLHGWGHAIVVVLVTVNRWNRTTTCLSAHACMHIAMY